MPTLPPVTVQSVFGHWTLTPVLTAIAVVLTVGYLAALLRVRTSGVGVTWSPWRTAAFLLGTTLIVVVVNSGVGVYADVVLWLHMVQHLTLIMVAPVLLAAGRPLGLILAALPARRRRGWWRALRTGPAVVLTHPAFGVAFYAVVVIGTHLTPFQNARVLHDWVAVLELLLFLAVGWLLFTPLVGGEPVRWRPSFPGAAFALALTMPVDTFTGLLLMLSPGPRWPAVAALNPPWGASPTLDTQIAGAIMWVGGDWLMLLIILALFSTWSWNASRRSVRSQGAGRWLESVRRTTLSDAVGGLPSTAESIDDDDRALAAYNAHLRRLHGAEHERGSR